MGRKTVVKVQGFICRIHFWCPYIQSGGLGGFRAFFLLRILFVFSSPSCPPRERQPDFKGVGETVLTEFYSWVSILSAAAFACCTKHSRTQVCSSKCGMDSISLSKGCLTWCSLPGIHRGLGRRHSWLYLSVI